MNSILGFRKLLKYGRFHRRRLGSCEFVLKRNAKIFKFFLKKIMHKIEAYECMLLSYCYNSITAYYYILLLHITIYYCNILLPYCKNIQLQYCPNIYYNISLKFILLQYFVTILFCQTIILLQYYIDAIFCCDIAEIYCHNILLQYFVTIILKYYIGIILL